MKPTFFMDNNCDHFLFRVVTFTPEYAPHTPGTLFFEKIKIRMIDVENWDSRTELDRSVFEKELINDRELEHTYVDLYSKTSRFFSLPFEIDKVNYEFYCMVDNMEIILIFYRSIN